MNQKSDMREEASVFNPPAQDGSVDRKIVAALERLGRVFRVLLRREAANHGLSPIQIQFLVFLRFHPESSARVSALARRFDLTPATVSDAVATLADKALLAKEPDPADRRARVLRLTGEGAALAAELSGWADEVTEHLGSRSEAEKLIVMRFLMDVIAGLQEEGVITVARMCTTCRFFRSGAHSDDAAAPHHCALLDKPLAPRDLRVDCPEHELPAGVR